MIKTALETTVKYRSKERITTNKNGVYHPSAEVLDKYPVLSNPVLK